MKRSLRSYFILFSITAFFGTIILESCGTKRCDAYDGGSRSNKKTKKFRTISCPSFGGQKSSVTGWEYNGSNGQGEDLKSDIQLRKPNDQELKWRAVLAEENINRRNYFSSEPMGRDMDLGFYNRNANLYPSSDSISIADNVVYKDGKLQDKEIDDAPTIPDYATAYEQYDSFTENDWIETRDEEKSTFSIDVDNASYTNFRRYVNQGKLPPKDAVRVEEWVNYFNYELEAPAETDEHPMKVTSEIGACPWAPEDDLLMIKMQGKKPPSIDQMPASNLVFLVDVSGSMSSYNKLTLVQSSMKKLTQQLRKEDKISIVTYAGASTIALEPTSGDQKDKINQAIDGLRSGGGTYGSQGITTAYDLAEKNLMTKGNNRVILCTDGDWNIGVTNDNDLKKLIEEKRETGVFLSVLGLGMGNLNDKMMEMLADNGNGNYAYIDDQKEADRIFFHEFGATMHTIAKDVKLQIEFNDDVVDQYRLLGYENRVLENWEFDDDAVDAGDMGMGHNVIAFYQIRKKEGQMGSVGKLDFRYKPVDSDVSTLLSHDFNKAQREISSDFNFASCVIEFAMCLRESEYRGDAEMMKAIIRGRKNLGDESDSLSYAKRVEFVGLMEAVGGKYEDYVVVEAPKITKQLSPDLKLYPNPTSDFTTVEVTKDQSHKWSIQLFDLSGALKIVQHFKETTTGRIDMSELPNGTYIVKVYGLGYNFGYMRVVKI